MFTVIVYLHVKREYLDVFIQATLDNAQNSQKEPGVIAFDMLQQQDDPTRLVLYETYRTAQAQLDHRETPHYLKWRETIADMFEEPRYAIKYDVLSPAET